MQKQLSGGTRGGPALRQGRNHELQWSHGHNVRDAADGAAAGGAGGGGGRPGAGHVGLGGARLLLHPGPRSPPLHQTLSQQGETREKHSRPESH